MKKVTEIMMWDWLGSNAKLHDVIALLTEVANGDYSVVELKKDVLQYNEDMEDELYSERACNE